MTHGQSRNRQQGMTLLGFLILGTFVGLFVLAGIKLVPVYMEYAKIKSTLEQVRDEHEGQKPSIEQIRSAIERRFDIESVTTLTARDIQITRIEGGFEMRATYDGRTSYLGNLYLVAEFDNSVEVMR